MFEFESSMLKTHKFQIGQTVCFTSRPVGHMTANDIYRIVKLLPSDGEDYPVSYTHLTLPTIYSV